MKTQRREDEPDSGTLVAMAREGKISRDTLDELLTRRQMPLFGANERRSQPRFTPEEQGQLCLFLTDDRQRQLSLSLAPEARDAGIVVGPSRRP